jgi:hypothetical protein
LSIKFSHDSYMRDFSLVSYYIAPPLYQEI